MPPPSHFGAAALTSALLGSEERRTMADDKAADYLAQEYLFLQKTVEDFDARALTIKAWSVTFSAAGLGFAYQQHNPSCCSSPPVARSFSG